MTYNSDFVAFASVDVKGAVCSFVNEQRKILIGWLTN